MLTLKLIIMKQVKLQFQKGVCYSFKKNVMLLFFLGMSFVAFAQNTVAGKVTDQKGEPIIGATIKAKGTGVGTITDVNGAFKISSNGTLVISYIGYQSQEVKINGKSSLLVQLNENDKLLDEVVVVGYGAKKKASLTSAISQIGQEAFKDKGVSNAAVALQGQVPGLVVTRSSSRPGSEGVALKIRGDISINGNSTPLIIIDGMTGSMDEFSQMDPNNIESVSVLKDASAAIYGSRSASGVVLVTTKRGKGKTKVNYSGSVSGTIDGIKCPVTNQTEWLTMFKEAQVNDGLAIGQPTNWWIFQNIGGEAFVDRLIKGEVITQVESGKTVRYEPTDLQDFMYGQAFSQKHNLSISGSDEKFGYMASLGYSNSQSQLKIADDREKKWNALFNADYKATKTLKISSGISYNRRLVTTPRSGVGGGFTDMYFWPIYNKSGQFYDTFATNRNPAAYIVNGGNVNTMLETFRINTSATLDLSQYVNGLSLKADGSFKKVEKKTTTLQKEVSFYDWEGVFMSKKDGPGKLTEEINNWENQTYGIYANYVRSFNQVHNVSAMIGMTAEQESNKVISANRSGGFLYPGTDLVDLNTTIGGTGFEGAGGGQSSWGLVSYLTRLDYDYKGKYLVGFLGRRDGSSKLFPEFRWRNFYSVSGAWRVSEENFMKGLPFINNLKLRYNYGQTGSVEGIGNYESYATMSTGSYIYGNDNNIQTAVWLGGMSSSSRTWETISKHDAGIDFAFLNNRLSGSFDWFSNLNDGMFIQVAYPSVIGAGAPKTNSGKFRTNGWDFNLDWKDKVGSVTYNIGLVLGNSQSEILKLASVTRAFAGNNVTLEGKPLNAIYAYKTDGIFQTQDEVNAYYSKYYFQADGTTMKTGNIIPANNPASTNRLRPGARKLADVDNDGIITDKDIIYMGDKAPHYSFGVKMGLEWNGIDFNAFFQGVGSQMIQRGGYLYAPFVTNYTQQNKTFIGKTWTETNTNTNYTILSRDQNFNKWNYQNNDAAVDNSKYIRLKSLVVGYTLPSQMTKKVGIEKLRIYFSGDDLWEATTVKDGYDPEFGEGSNNTFPFSRLLTVGLNVTL